MKSLLTFLKDTDLHTRAFGPNTLFYIFPIEFCAWLFFWRNECIQVSNMALYFSQSKYVLRAMLFIGCKDTRAW